MPEPEHVLRRWKSWEAGDTLPGDRYQGLIAKTFGTTRFAMFPAPGAESRDIDVLAVTGMDTLEILTRVQRSDVDAATLEALRITVDRLCSEYAYTPSEQLLLDGRDWLARVAELRNRRLTLAQHREVLTLAGWLALLVGCVEYDAGDRLAAEATRRAALSLGTEAGSGEIQGWAHEMRAWFALTSGDYRGVVAAARAGTLVAPRHGVAAQFDFYAMDVYRILGVDSLASSLATEVLRSVPADRAPMRAAEASITLGVVAARAGDLEQAVAHGRQALGAGGKRSVPSLRMTASELAAELEKRYVGEREARDYLDQLGALDA